MSDKINIEVWIRTNKVGSDCYQTIDFNKEEWEEMSDEEKDEICKEVTFEYLEWVTGSENQKHANILGMNKPPKKLDEKEVVEIKKLLNEKIKQYLIAEKFNVTQSQISNIKRNKLWSNVHV